MKWLIEYFQIQNLLSVLSNILFRLYLINKSNHNSSSLTLYLFIYLYLRILKFIKISSKSHSLINYINMNFETSSELEVQLSNLLAFIIMFEKKIQFIKCRLAGNQQFHTRLAFQRLDHRKRNEIGADQIGSSLLCINAKCSQTDCSLFVRRYSNNGHLTYEEFLKLITPKTNKTLAQRMMIRNLLTGAHLEDYLFKLLLELIELYVKMSSITQNLRRKILKNSQLSHLDIIELLKKFRNQRSMFYFITKSNNEGQYDLEERDVLFLSKHIRSGNDLFEFTDTDIKELICPIDMNYQKPVQKTYANFLYHTHEQPQQNQAKTMNFLNKTYQKTGFVNKKRQNPLEQISAQVSNRFQPYSRKQIPQPNVDGSYHGLYIDNFVKGNAGGIELDQFFNKNKKIYERFEDDLSNGSSISRRSAFMQY